VSKSPFAKRTWRLNEKGWEKLDKFLKWKGIDRENIKHGDKIKAASCLGVDRKTALVILNNGGRNLKDWRTLFLKLYKLEFIEDSIVPRLDDKQFQELYCEEVKDDEPSFPTEEVREAQLPNSSDSSDVFLMIKVKPHLPSISYVISACLVKGDRTPSSEILENDRQDYKLIDVGGQPFKVEEFPQVFYQILESCHTDYTLSKLTVQWFLPIEQMSLPIEHWQIPIGRRQYECGKKCQFVQIRSYDRHFTPNYNPILNDWKCRWEQFLKLSANQCDRVLRQICPNTEMIESCSLESEMFGYRFIEANCPKQQEDFWDELLAEGIPIALWMRRSAPLLDESVLNDIISNCPIADLPQSLTKARKQALSRRLDRTSEPILTDSATHLSLLWDNPFQPFPDDIEYQSA
jgi:vWA-MoxR associated protein C-terminal domain